MQANIEMYLIHIQFKSDLYLTQWSICHMSGAAWSNVPFFTGYIILLATGRWCLDPHYSGGLLNIENKICSTMMTLL